MTRSCWPWVRLRYRRSRAHYLPRPEDPRHSRTSFHTLLTGSARRLAFVLPPTPTRHLPLYELALETRNFLSDRGSRRSRHHDRHARELAPRAFGAGAGDELGQLLVERDIQLITSGEVTSYVSGELFLSDQRSVLGGPRCCHGKLEGLRVPGIPCDADGFVPVDGHCRVVGVDDVYAAGDMTSFPFRHGGIATQQADAAAEVIASSIGIPIEPRPFQPVLRSQLLTGMFPRFLRLDANGARHTMSTEAPWWPSAKIVGRYLTPFLTRELGLPRTDLPAGAESDDRVLEWQPRGGWTPI